MKLQFKYLAITQSSLYVDFSLLQGMARNDYIYVESQGRKQNKNNRTCCDLAKVIGKICFFSPTL